MAASRRPGQYVDSDLKKVARKKNNAKARVQGLQSGQRAGTTTVNPSLRRAGTSPKALAAAGGNNDLGNREKDSMDT